MINCPGCSAANKPSSQFCFACGRPLVQMCPMGHQYPLTETKCPTCLTEEEQARLATRPAASQMGGAGGPGAHQYARTRPPDDADYGPLSGRPGPTGRHRPASGPGRCATSARTVIYEEDEGAAGTPDMLVGWLVVMDGYDDSPYTYFSLTDGDNVIGQRTRGNRVDVEIADKKVSQTHAVISHEKGTYWIHDENSSNGTFVNGGRIGRKPPVRLADNDVVHVGRTRLVFKTFTNPLG